MNYCYIYSPPFSLSVFILCLWCVYIYIYIKYSFLCVILWSIPCVSILHGLLYPSFNSTKFSQFGSDLLLTENNGSCFLSSGDNVVNFFLLLLLLKCLGQWTERQKYTFDFFLFLCDKLQYLATLVDWCAKKQKMVTFIVDPLFCRTNCQVDWTRNVCRPYWKDLENIQLSTGVFCVHVHACTK